MAADNRAALLTRGGEGFAARAAGETVAVQLSSGSCWWVVLTYKDWWRVAARREKGKSDIGELQQRAPRKKRRLKTKWDSLEATENNSLCPPSRFAPGAFSHSVNPHLKQHNKQTVCVCVCGDRGFSLLTRRVCISVYNHHLCNLWFLSWLRHLFPPSTSRW